MVVTVVKVKKMRPEAVIPTRATAGSAGYDLYACIPKPVIIPCSQTRSIPTGIAIELTDPTVVALIYARSGMGIKEGVAPGNAVGVIDSDYRGEILVGLYNHSEKFFVVHPGDRIAQMLISPVYLPDLVESDELADTSRGDGGLGSTGME